MVGAVLACAGGGYQATFRNPLADPYLLGVAAGAGLGVTIAITDTGAEPGLGQRRCATLAAFVGALVAVGLAYVLGLDADRTRSTASLILAGVAVAALFTALQTFLLQRERRGDPRRLLVAARPVQRRRLGRGAAAGCRTPPCRSSCIVARRPPARRADASATTKPSPSASTPSPCGDSSILAAIARHRRRRVGERPHRLRRHHRPPRRAPAGRLELPPRPAARRHPRRPASCASPTSSPARCAAPAEIPIGVITAVVGAPFFLLVLRTSRAARP